MKDKEKEQMISKTFDVGKRVTWKSQAAGSWKVKVGKVIEVVQPHHQPKTIRHLGSRNHVSYVVEVPRGGKSKKVDRYWPIASNLRGAR